MKQFHPIHIDIHRLGKVCNSQIELAPLMIFSGESGLGKSYLAILCHYFFEILLNRSRLNNFFVENSIDYKQLRNQYKGEGTALRIKKSIIEGWLAKDAVAYLGYMLNKKDLVGELKVHLPDVVPEELSFRYKEELTGLVNSEEVYLVLSLDKLSSRFNDSATFDESPFAFLLRYRLIAYLFGSHYDLKRTFVLPPSRGPILTERIQPNSGLYMEFEHDLAELARPMPQQETPSAELQALFQAILLGEVQRKDDQFYYVSGGVTLPLSAAAASVREIAPLEQLVKNTDISVLSILIEEPEAHLHAMKQRMMADIISGMRNAGAFLQITTHSDYFLRRLNELILLKQALDKGVPEASIEDIGIPRELALDAGDIAAYILEENPDGTSQAQQQTLKSGVPYSAFRDAINQSLQTLDKLETLLADETD